MSDKLLIDSSTRSVGMNLARRLNRGPRAGGPRGVAAPGKANEVVRVA
jgi:hypothetical protein